MNGHVLVVGVGNRWRGDDAAGLAVAARLHRTGTLATVLELEGEPLALLDAWAGTDQVILVDTVLSGAPAGTVHRLDASAKPLPATLVEPSTHAFGLADTIELARALERLPAHVEIYGVEGSCFAARARLSPEVQEGVDAVVAELVERFGPRPVKPRAGMRPAERDPSDESVGRAARPASASSPPPSEDECGDGRGGANYWRL